jgi:polyisoprenoid-binding protein YceI
MAAMTSTDPVRRTPASRESRSPSWIRVGLAGLLLAIVAGGAFGIWYLFLRPAPPAAVSLPSLPAATAAMSPAASAAAPSGPAASTAAGALDGTWQIDPSIGSFDDFSGSFVGYRVQEELASIGAQEAVGRTPDVTGSLTIAGTTITAVDATANLTTLQSDDDRRDGQLGRQGIETDTFPTATFRITAPIELGELPAEGETISVTATGELMLHGETRPVEVPLQARVSGGVISVTGSIPIAFADYGIERPRSMLVLSIADEGTMEFQLHFTPA